MRRRRTTIGLLEPHIRGLSEQKVSTLYRTDNKALELPFPML